MLTWAQRLRFSIFLHGGAVALRLRDEIAQRLSPNRPLVKKRRSAAATSSPLLRKLLLSHGTSQIEAQLAIPEEKPRALVLICHGIGERLYFWSKVQLLLAEVDVGSLVFHYTSYGQSRGPCTPEGFESSAQAAYAYLASLVPEAPLFLFGTSLGTAVAAQVAATLQPAPAGVILSQGFPSLREAGKSVLARLNLALLPVHGWLPDVWRSAENLAAIAPPVLVIHSPDDELFSREMGERLYAGAASRRDGRQYMTLPADFAHDDVSLRPSMGYWQPILDFIRAETDHFTRNAEAATRSPPNPSTTAVTT